MAKQAIERKLIHRDIVSLDTLKSRTEPVIHSLQEAQDHLTKHGHPPFTTEEIEKLMADQDFLHNRVLDSAEAPTIAGVKISRKKFREMVEIEGCDCFYDAARTAREYIDRYTSSRSSILRLIKVENGKVIFDPAVWAQVEEEHSYYATTPEELSLYSDMESIAAITKRMMAIAGHDAHTNLTRVIDNNGNLNAGSAASLLSRIKQEAAAKR